IARLREACIILSPTTTIRNQWGERFTENFATDGGDYVSYDLRKLKPITSVTYQSLHAAVKRLTDEESGESYASLDLIGEIRKFGIKTVCLDEAHHLQNEWQRALEQFLSELKGEIKIIALTATPPYDAKTAEWNRYTDICGEIDEEIFVPELVKENSLCPHQDFIYFNYPTDEETASLAAYRRRAADALDELTSSNALVEAHDRFCDRKTDYEFLYNNTESLVCLLTLFKKAGYPYDKKTVRTLTCGDALPKATAERLSIAANYLINGDLLDDYRRNECINIFKRHGVIERGEIQLDLNDKLKKAIISSTGKLNSISDIVKSESENRRDKLRMLILTDYIKKDSLSMIGSEKSPDAVSIVSVFETVRRTGATVGALSGSLVVLPSSLSAPLKKEGADFTAAPLGDTGYSSYEFRAGNREKVRLVSRLFESGAITVLVGTKSLLGEGWDPHG
ncbi:MAG: DEAD/DEAH box helicase family protein, partial [Clostridia bacterium]|nr:DEAD/DEAH box helicase family protein [Clostridia bacterium]